MIIDFPKMGINAEIFAQRLNKLNKDIDKEINKKNNPLIAQYDQVLKNKQKSNKRKNKNNYGSDLRRKKRGKK